MTIGRKPKKRSGAAAILIGLLLSIAALCSGAAFRLAEPGSKVYYTVAVIAGEDVRLNGAAQITGAVHSNGDLDLAKQSTIEGDVSVVGSLSGQGTISGDLQEGAAPVALPALDEGALRQLADRVVDGDLVLTDEALTDVLFVDGQVTVTGTFGGTGTLIASGDILLESVDEAPLADGTLLSLISLGSIQLEPRRAIRGVVHAGLDVKLNPSAVVEGVVVAGREARLLNDATVTFVDFDTTPPVVTLVTPTDGSILGVADPVIELAFTDDLSGVALASVQFLVDGTDVTAASTIGPDGLLYTPPPLADGGHLLEISLADVSGNPSQASFTFSTDTTAPAITVVAPSGTVNGDATPAIQVSYADALAGVDLGSLLVTVDGNLLGDCQVSATGATCEPQPLADGEHTVEARISDLVGNEGVATGTFVVVLDQEPPTISVTAPIGTLINERTPQIVLALADDASGIDPGSLLVRVDGQLVPGCTADASSATCTPAPLGEGTHRITAEVRDNVGNTGFGQGVFTLELDEDGPLVQILSPVAGTVNEGRAPGVTASFADLESGVDLSTLRVTLDAVPLATCTATAEGVTCTLAPEPAVGPHTVTVSIADTLGNLGSESVSFEILADTRPPRLQLLSPVEEVVLGNARPEIRLGYRDAGTGVDLATFEVAIDGVAIDGCTVDPEEAVCTPPPLAAGARVLTASIADRRGNVRQLTSAFEIDLRLELEILAPATGLLTRADAVEVSGTVSPLADEVSVAGVAAVLQDGTFVAEGVPLEEGGNTLSAVARSAGGALGTATVSVVRDTEPPQLTILTPPDGFVTTSSQIFVTGEYNDRVSSNTDVTPAAIRVNGVAATVEQRSFLVEDVLLQPGENRLVAEVVDAAGNAAQAAVTVTLVTGNTLRIEELQGNFQQGVVGETLPQPLVVRLRDGLGMPLPNRLVTFTVSRGTGEVSVAGERGREVSVLSDELGMARVDFTLGERAGKGNHEVLASSVGFPGGVVFCASGTFGAPERIVSIVGDNNSGAFTGAVGQTYPKPLLTQVFDRHGNPLPEVEVTYEVVLGDGVLVADGGPDSEVTTPTDGQGIAGATFVLGPEAGFNNQVVTARFAGLDGTPAVFTLSAIEPGNEAHTAVVGIVLDNEDRPVPGVTVHLGDTTLTTTTDPEGRFRLDGAPVGTVHLEVDGTTTSRPGVWPHLAFEFTTFPGQDNELGMPIRLLSLDDAGAAIVGGDEDVTLTLDGVPGAELTVFANSVTFPDGSKVGPVSFTQVHADKVPMVAPLGSGFMLAVTIQPPGTVFDPPARLAIPNMGDAPGKVVDIFSFDHDLGEFVTSGTATVSADGRQLVSNPGFGVSKAGWHGCVPPVPTTNPCSPGACTVCTPDGPAPKCGKCASCDGGTCKPRKIESVKAVAVAGGGEPQEEKTLAKVDDEVEFEAKELRSTCRTHKYSWDFGDGETGEGALTAHAYEEPGTYTVTLKVTCEGCSEAGSAEDTVSVQAVKLNLEARDLAEETEETPHEEDPGVFLVVNTDDDNANDVADWTESGAVSGEDDLVRVKLELEGEPDVGELELDAPSGLEKIRVWEGPTRTERIELPKTWNLEEDDPPTEIFVEAVSSSALKDVELEATLMHEGGDVGEDKVVFTAVQFFVFPGDDAEIDADNSALQIGAAVLLRDGDDKPKAVEDGAVVEWSVESGGGSVSDGSSETEDGLATTVLELGTGAGTTSAVEGSLKSLEIEGETIDIEGVFQTSGEFRVVPGRMADLDIQKSKPGYAADDRDTLTLTLTARDQFGNLAEDGTSVFWNLDGLGDIAGDETTSGGSAQISLRSGFDPGVQEVTLQVGEEQRVETLEVSEVVATLTPSAVSLNVERGEVATVTASFTDSSGNPVADGTRVLWFTSSGQIAGSPSTSGGLATATLSAAGGRIGETLISAQAQNGVATARVDFTSDIPIVPTIEHPVLVGDAAQDGFVQVEQLDGTFLDVPFFARSKVTVQGPPGTVLTPTLSTFEPVAGYTFDAVDGDTVVDGIGDHDATVDGATLDTTTSIAGPASLSFDGMATMTIPVAPEFESADGFQVVLWALPRVLQPSTLLRKGEDYELVIGMDGRLVFRVTTSAGTFETTSAEPLQVGVWQRIRAEIINGGLLLFVDGASSNAAAPGALMQSGADLVFGDGYEGNIDQTTLSTARPSASGLLAFEGLSTGQVTLDENGSAEFFVVSSGTLGDPTAVEEISLGLIADTGAAGLRLGPSPHHVIIPPPDERIVVVGKELWGIIWNFLVGFAWGEGDGAPAVVGDIVAGFLFIGDARDILKEVARFMPGGMDPDYLILTFAVLGMALDFLPPAAAVNGVLAATKVLLKRLGRNLRGPFIKVLFRLVQDAIVIFRRDGSDAALAFLGRNAELLIALASRGDEVTDLLSTVIRSNRSLDEVAVIFKELGDEGLDTLISVPRLLDVSDAAMRAFTSVFSKVNDAAKVAIKNSEDAVAGLAKMLDSRINPQRITDVINKAAFSGNYGPAEFLADGRRILDSSPGITGLDSALGRIAKQEDAGLLFEFRLGAALSEGGDAVESIGRRSLDSQLIDVASDSSLSQAVLSSNALIGKGGKGTRGEKLIQLRQRLLNAQKLARDGSSELGLAGGREFKIVMPDNVSLDPDLLELLNDLSIPFDRVPFLNLGVS